MTYVYMKIYDMTEQSAAPVSHHQHVYRRQNLAHPPVRGGLESSRHCIGVAMVVTLGPRQRAYTDGIGG
jgi:hypothetical protein